jgi:hypothetical protein
MSGCCGQGEGEPAATVRGSPLGLARKAGGDYPGLVELVILGVLYMQ